MPFLSHHISLEIFSNLVYSKCIIPVVQGKNHTHLGFFLKGAGYSYLISRLFSNPANSNFKMLSESRTPFTTLPPWPVAIASQLTSLFLALFLYITFLFFNSEISHPRHARLLLWSNLFNAFLTHIRVETKALEIVNKAYDLASLSSSPAHLHLAFGALAMQVIFAVSWAFQAHFCSSFSVPFASSFLTP